MLLASDKNIYGLRRLRVSDRWFESETIV